MAVPYRPAPVRTDSLSTVRNSCHSMDQHRMALAARNNNVRIVDLLLKRGANVDELGEEGETAAENDDLEMIDVLLQAGAPLEAEGSASRTPLLTAVSRGRDQIAMGMRLGLSGSL